MTTTMRWTLLKAIGPGILLAGAAIGVSHLVQATRAGAEFRFGLLGLLVLACATKYPFLEFGPRYAAATGRTAGQPPGFPADEWGSRHGGVARRGTTW
jgi:Mn2+/Fe2+ NRAMP family transporter